MGAGRGFRHLVVGLGTAIIVAGCAGVPPAATPTPVAPEVTFTPKDPATMTADDRAGVALIERKDREAAAKVAAKVAAWNAAKDAAVMKLNSQVATARVRLEGALRSGAWGQIKVFLAPGVAKWAEFSQLAGKVHRLDGVSLTATPVTVPDMQLLKLDPAVRWEDSGRYGDLVQEVPYREYAEVYMPIFISENDSIFSEGLFEPEPWVAPESVTLAGTMAASGETFSLPLQVGAKKSTILVKDLVGAVPGLVDPENEVSKALAVVEQKDAAARAKVPSAADWNAAKDAGVAAYKSSLGAQLDPSKVDQVQTAIETGDWATLRPFLDEERLAKMGLNTDSNPYESVKGLGDITLVPYLEPVEDIELPELIPALTPEEWCEDQGCDGPGYASYAELYEAAVGKDDRAVPVSEYNAPTPQPWKAPEAASTVMLVNDAGGLDVYVPVKLSMITK